MSTVVVMRLSVARSRLGQLSLGGFAAKISANGAKSAIKKALLDVTKDDGKA